MTAKNAEPARRRRERGSIDPDLIVSGAFDLAEQTSLDQLSMPLLGKHLGVGVTSIYWYFRKKDDLLNAMTDRALRRYMLAVPLPTGLGWRETFETYARTMRKVFLNNPILIDLILIRATLGPRYAALGARHIEGLVTGLVTAGFSADSAFNTISVLQLHLHGSIVLNRLNERAKATDAGFRTYYEDLTITPDRTPLLAAAAESGRLGGEPNAANFEFGLTWILDQAEALLESDLAHYGQ